MRSSTHRTSRGNLANEAGRAPRSNLPLLILFLVTKRSTGKSSPNGLAFELPPRGAGHGLPRAGRDVSHFAQSGADAALHAGGNAGHGEGAATANARGCGHPDSSREYLSFVAASRSRSLPPHGWYPRFHELETLGADGLGWVSDFL